MAALSTGMYGSTRSEYGYWNPNIRRQFTDTSGNVRVGYIIIPFDSFADNTPYLTDELLRSFERPKKFAPVHVFCGRPRAREGGLDYKTPQGERGLWAAPEPAAEDLPRWVSFPRWREYARRRA